jgi:hypothetical protein
VADILLQALPGAMGGLVTGIIASLIAPWVQWAVEKRRSKLNYRQELIRKWRKEIEDLALGGKVMFGGTVTYSEIRPHLRKEVRDSLEQPRTFRVPNEARGDNADKAILLDEVARIEKEWGLA